MVYENEGTNPLTRSHILDLFDPESRSARVAISSWMGDLKTQKEMVGEILGDNSYVVAYKFPEYGVSAKITLDEFASIQINGETEKVEKLENKILEVYLSRLNAH